MTNLNKAMLIGRLGQDPETRYTKSGSAVASFTVATNDYWRDKQGNRQEKTDWHNIVAWGQQADFVQNYLKKGRLVYVEGRLQTRDWVDQQNVKHYKTEIVANTIRSLERLEEGAPAEGRSGSRDYTDYSPARGEQSGEGKATAEGEEPYLEDDIPF